MEQTRAPDAGESLGKAEVTTSAPKRRKRNTRKRKRQSGRASTPPSLNKRQKVQSANLYNRIWDVWGPRRRIIVDTRRERNRFPPTSVSTPSDEEEEEKESVYIKQEEEEKVEEQEEEQEVKEEQEEKEEKTPATFPEEDTPREVPEEFHGILPNFDACCGQHSCRYARHLCLAQQGSFWEWVACRDCGEPRALATLHRLPCGHALCRRCLREAVRTISRRIAWPASWRVVQQHLYEHFYGPAPPPPAHEEEEEEEEEDDGRSTFCLTTPRGGGTIRRRRAPMGPLERAHEAVGFTCCGRSMRLVDDHLACLEREDAVTLWMAREALRFPPEELREVCGWPDCRRFLSPAYQFVSRNGEAMWHCVWCGGNSNYTGSGALIPAR